MWIVFLHNPLIYNINYFAYCNIRYFCKALHLYLNLQSYCLFDLNHLSSSLNSYSYYNYSYKISSVLVFLELLLKLHQIFGSELFHVVLKILKHQLHRHYLYKDLLIFHKLHELFVRQLNLLVNQQ